MPCSRLWTVALCAWALAAGACSQDGSNAGDASATQPNVGVSAPTPGGASGSQGPTPTGTSTTPSATDSQAGSGAAGTSGDDAVDGTGGAGGAAASGGAGEDGSTADAGVGTDDAGVGDATDAGGSMTDVGDGPPEKFCGNITTLGMVRSDFIDYWDQITPENEGKWGSVEPVRDQMSWGGLDAAYEYARQHGIPFKQHTFVWGSQQPGWIAGLPPNEQREEVEEWIRLYCERYPDTDMIDVVNEPPPHTTPPYAEALGGAGDSGYDWIVQSFVWARQYCPNAVLILNDYNTIEWPGDNEHFIDIVNRILAAGAPIDAIGAQAHAAYDVPTATVEAYVDALAATGLPVYISEYDINLADDEQQRQVMAEQFTMFWNHDSVPGVTLWGYVEGQTWLEHTGLMSPTGQQRPAMTWLMEYLDR